MCCTVYMPLKTLTKYEASLADADMMPAQTCHNVATMDIEQRSVTFLPRAKPANAVVTLHPDEAAASFSRYGTYGDN